METIVEYTDTKVPLNQYPHRIISPSQSGPCCFSETEAVGPVEHGDRWVYRYKRCRACGFTVRVVLREVGCAETRTRPWGTKRGSGVVVLVTRRDSASLRRTLDG